jgi:hypothetical protein
VAAIGAEEFDVFVPKLLPVTIELALALRTGHPENFRHGSSRSSNKIRNSKHEIRNKHEGKQISNPENPKRRIRINPVLNLCFAAI